MAKIRLGDLLVRAGVLDEGKLKAALAQQQRWGGRLGRILVDMSFLSEDLLVKALSKQLGIARARFDNAPVPNQVLRAVGVEFCRTHRVVPERYDPQKKLLHLAMADVFDVKALDELRFKTGLRIEPTIAGDMALGAEIDRRFDVYGSGGIDMPGGSGGFAATMAASGVPLSSDLPGERTSRGLNRLELSSKGMPPIEATSRGVPAVARPPIQGSPSYAGAAPPVPQQGLPTQAPAPLGGEDLQGLGIGFAPNPPAAGPPPSEAARDLALRLERAQRQQNKALRVMVELMIDKGVFTREEYIELVGRPGGYR